MSVSRKPPARKPPAKKKPTARRDVRRGDTIHPALRDLPMFEFMSDELRKLVAESFVPLSFPFGTLIVKEGEDADALFVLASGRARAVQHGEGGEEVPLHVLQPGDTFGERGLLSESPRTASVRASSEVEALRLDRSLFQALVRRYPQIRESFALHIRRMDLENFFKLYSAFASLPPDAMALMLRELRSVEVRKGQAVVREGEPPGAMYIVEEGKLRAYKKIGRRNQDVAYLRKADFFGEVSTLKHSPREATVEAVTDVRLLALEPKTYSKLLKQFPAFREEIRRRVAQYDYQRTANVPLDFAEEILPAEVAKRESVVPTRVADEAPDLDEPTPDETFVKPSRRIRGFPIVYQLDEMDCGAACLAMATRYFGRPVKISHIRDVVGVSADGTSLLGITEGAQTLGLAARSVKASKSRLDEMPLPAVAHFDGNHWVVVHDVDRRRVRVADPAIGSRRMKRAEFEDKWSGYAALLARTPALDDAPVDVTRSRWIWTFIKPHRGTLIRAAILALVAAGLAMLIPVFSQLVVDHVIAKGDLGLLTTVVLGMLGVLVMLTVATVAQRYLLSRTAVTIDGTTLDFIMGKLLALPMSYFYARRTGDISRRLSGFRQAREFFVQQGVEALTASTQLIVAIVLMFVYSPLLTLVFVAVLPGYVALMRLSIRRLRPMYDSLEEAWGKYHSRQIDAIKGIETVKSIGAEELLRGRLVEQFRGLSRRLFRADFMVMVFQGAVDLVTFLSLALFLWVGAHQVIDGHLTVGGLVSFNALVLLANGPAQLLVSMWDDFQLASVLLNRLNDVFEQDPEQGADRSALKDVRSLGGAIRFRDVWFWYPGPHLTPILEGIDLDVPAGTTVAIVGRSGSGKTTLVKCLAGLIVPTRGSITYDGVDMLTLDHRQLRQSVGFVLQDPYLFDDTIARNIAFGTEEPDMEQVERAARIANAHDFIERLPLGYDTWIGETGLLLSGGQRQRIAIARAVYAEPPVLIFDEATSSLDTESEKAVQANVDRLLEGRTSFVIAHRLSTIRGADMIVVLEKGKVVEQGTHDDLMARQGLYYYLVSQQLSV